METRIIEAEGVMNYGKFLLARMDTEWERTAAIPTVEGIRHVPLLDRLGWTRDHLWVLDLATGEGALFRPGGHAGADLNKHRVWVCPLFEPFLTWLYTRDLADLSALPVFIRLDAAEPSLYGYRRPGPAES